MTEPISRRSTSSPSLGSGCSIPRCRAWAALLSYRDGRTAAVRNDGQPTFKPTGDTVILDVLTGAGQGKVTPYDLMAEAFRNKRARLHAAPTVEAGWKGAMSNLGDLYLQSRSVGAGSYKFQNPRIRSLQLAGVDLLRQRVLAHSAKGDLQSWVQKDFLRDTTDMLTGPIGSAS